MSYPLVMLAPMAIFVVAVVTGVVASMAGVVAGWRLARRRPAPRGDVGEVRAELSRLQESLARTHGELRQQLLTTNQQTASLTETAGALREVLASPKARGQWGERMADDVLRVAGLVEGVSYVKQRATRHGTIPDVTFLLPGGQVLHMDVKFPVSNAASPDQFLRDVRARVKEVTGRGYVDPAGGTLDYVLLFVPNESLYAAIHEHDPGLIDEALGRKVVLCSPLTLFAVLAVVRRAADVAALERTSGEVLAVLGTFSQEWDRFCDALDKVGRTVDAMERAYGDLAGTRRRALERPLARIEELRRHGVDEPERLRAVP
jgi:DNA recombination protein RmuC